MVYATLSETASYEVLKVKTMHLFRCLILNWLNDPLIGGKKKQIFLQCKLNIFGLLNFSQGSNHKSLHFIRLGINQTNC